MSPIVVPPAAIACQLCAGVPGTHVAGAELRRGNHPAHVRHVGGPPRRRPLPRPHFLLRADGARVLEVFLDRLRECALLVVVGEAPDRVQVVEEEPADVLVREHVVEAVDDLMLHGRVGAERRRVGSLQDALPVRSGHFHRGMAVVVIDLGEVRDDVGRFAAPGDHVVDPAALVDVLAHQVHHEVHRFHRIERGAALVRRSGGVRRDAPEAELGRQVRQRISRTRVVAIPGMPCEDGVHIGEKPLAHHVHLPGAALLRGRPVHPDPPRRSGPLQPILRGEPGGDRGGPEQVMSAGVAGADVVTFERLGNRLLGDPGEGVELGEDADHRTAGSPFGQERGRHPGDAGLHREPGGTELLLEEAGALLLLVAHLGPFPDAQRDFLEVGPLGVQEARHGVGCAVVLRRCAQRNEQRGDEQQDAWR